MLSTSPAGSAIRLLLANPQDVKDPDQLRIRV
jgi:hypothetical protein